MRSPRPLKSRRFALQALLSAALLIVVASSIPPIAARPIDSTAALIAAGTYKLAAPLEPKAGMKLKGAGIDKTIITHVTGWKPSTKTLSDPEMTIEGLDMSVYLIRFQNNLISKPSHSQRIIAQDKKICHSG
jgi:hypothetical protein